MRVGPREGFYSGGKECCQEKFPEGDVTGLRGK